MPTYVVIETKASMKTAKVSTWATVIQTPATPKKAPTYGLIWPSGR